jgi:predicted transposase/invertase (TIGR01784 family)
MTARYINPYTDFGFKKLFGEEANKDILIDFLNAVLLPENKVADLTFRPTERLPNNTIDRKAIFDIACTGPKGESFTVEMQKAKQLWFKDRALFYSAFPIQRQAQRGDWHFKLNPVILVAVLDFEYDEEEERRKLYRLVSLKDQDGDPFSETLNMVFLQMPLFTMPESELATSKDKWLYFLKNLENFDTIPLILREPIFEKAFATAEYVNYSPAIQEAYRESQKAYWDNTNTFHYAVDTAEARELAKGPAEEKLAVARNLKQLGIPIATIAEATGLSQEEIEQLK